MFHHCPVTQTRVRQVMQWVITNATIQVISYYRYMDQSRFWWFIRFLWISPQCDVQSTICGSIHSMQINPQSVDQSKIFGSIHNMWIVYNLRISPQSVVSSTICEPFHKLWINPHSMVRSTIHGSIHNLWINPLCIDPSATVDTFKSVIAIPHIYVDKFTFW